eukprot:Skav232772  [mRNA]  locus=scaffold614:63668:64468:- [translate_table: standard]
MAHEGLRRLHRSLAVSIALCAKCLTVGSVGFLALKGNAAGTGLLTGHSLCSQGRRTQICRRVEDYWKVLGVEPGTTVKEVKRVYRQRAKKEHPDVDKSPNALQRWRQLSDAYGKLIDPAYRKSWEEAQQAKQRQSSRNTWNTRASSASGSDYAQRETQSDYSRSSSASRSSRSSRSPGAAFQEAKRWADTGWDYFRDLLRDREQGSSSYAVREWKAAEVELDKLRQELKKLLAEETKSLELTEEFRRREQKTQELQAGRRTRVERG